MKSKTGAMFYLVGAGVQMSLSIYNVFENDALLAVFWMVAATAYVLLGWRYLDE